MQVKIHQNVPHLQDLIRQYIMRKIGTTQQCPLRLQITSK